MQVVEMAAFRTSVQNWSVCYHEAAWAFSTYVIESHGLLSAHSGIRMSTEDDVRSTAMMYLYMPCSRLMISRAAWRCRYRFFTVRHPGRSVLYTSPAVCVWVLLQQGRMTSYEPVKQFTLLTCEDEITCQKLRLCPACRLARACAVGGAFSRQKRRSPSSIVNIRFCQRQHQNTTRNFATNAFRLDERCHTTPAAHDWALDLLPLHLLTTAILTQNTPHPVSKDGLGRVCL